MFDILLKHLLLEKAINTVFEKLQLNFTKVFPMPKRGEHIEIKYFTRKTKERKWIKDAVVQMATENAMLIIYNDWDTTIADKNEFPVATKKLELILKEDIIHWQLKYPNKTKYNISRDAFYNNPLRKN